MRITKDLKQPLIPAYVIAGILLCAAGIIQHKRTVETSLTVPDKGNSLLLLKKTKEALK